MDIFPDWSCRKHGGSIEAYTPCPKCEKENAAAKEWGRITKTLDRTLSQALRDIHGSTAIDPTRVKILSARVQRVLEILKVLG